MVGGTTVIGEPRRLYLLADGKGYPSASGATCGGLAPSIQSKVWSAMSLMRNRESAALIAPSHGIMLTKPGIAPCHGSMFSGAGKVIHGPAVAPLVVKALPPSWMK